MWLNQGPFHGNHVDVSSGKIFMLWDLSRKETFIHLTYILLPQTHLLQYFPKGPFRDSHSLLKYN